MFRVTDMSSTAAVESVFNRTGNMVDHSDPDGTESCNNLNKWRIDVIFLADPSSSDK